MDFLKIVPVEKLHVSLMLYNVYKEVCVCVSEGGGYLCEVKTSMAFIHFMYQGSRYIPIFCFDMHASVI